jgi:predicted ATP-grasp superfamily ATP-dependent carboligase
VTESSAAVIVGFELNGLGVARALAAHGVECIGLAAPFPNPAWKTKTCQVMPCAEWSGAAVLSKLIEIGRSRRRKPSLLITKEEPVRWISDAREQLAEYYEINLPAKPVVDLLLDKTDFERLCAEEGWPAPRTWSIESRSDLLAALPEIAFPCILKPRVKSAAFGDRSPRKAFKLADANELLRTHEMSAQWTERFILQEWIQGGEDRIAFCLTYVDRSGGPQAMFVGRKLRQWPPECGNTALCEPAPAEWREAICALTGKIWRRVGFTGLGSIEYKMELATGQPVLVEPTVGRTNYQNEIAVLNGVNIPLIAHSDLMGLGHPGTGRSRPCKLVDGIREIRSARSYFGSGELTLRRWLRDRSGRSRYMTLRLDDPGPLCASLMAGVRDVAATLLRGLFGHDFASWLKRALQTGGR